MASAASLGGAGELYFGMDFGTSGARGMVIDGDGALVADVRRGYGEGAADDWATAWETALFGLVADVPPEARERIVSISIDGTSATSMLLDAATGSLLAKPLLYNETGSPEALEAVKAMAPEKHTTVAPTSTLCKLVTWHQEGAWAGAKEPVLMHQADWLAWLLHGEAGATDYNNALKLGYDPGAEAYPDWLLVQPFSGLMPKHVVAPGAPLFALSSAVAERTGLPPGCMVCGGTTDSIAAFLAAGVRAPGQAVTSLGSTLALKVVSKVRVDDASYGVYSHRLGDTWLVGGASNTGGAVLRQLFTDAELKSLSERIDPAVESPLDYYPLTKPGERFPVADANLAPRLEPRPEDDAAFLHGVLESIARIEGEAYRLLEALGSDPLEEVYTAGGGAQNSKWGAIRERRLGVPVKPSPNVEAAYGAALLALDGARAGKA